MPKQKIPQKNTKDILIEKVAKGKTEEEAIKDFGDFDELVKEILSAYKINGDYDDYNYDYDDYDYDDDEVERF